MEGHGKVVYSIPISLVGAPTYNIHMCICAIACLKRARKAVFLGGESL